TPPSCRDLQKEIIMDRKRVGILVFPNVEVLDFCGPFEVFSVTRLNEEARREEPSPFEVLLVAERMDTVVATGGLKVVPDVTIDTCPPLDILVVPGGWGTRTEVHNQRLIDWIGERGRSVDTLTSVCTGSMLLGQAKLLDGRRATTHWRSLSRMREAFPSVTVEEKLHVVEDGHVVPSAGISAGIDMALRIVIRYFGEDVGRATARNMEYPFPDNNSRRVEHRCFPNLSPRGERDAKFPRPRRRGQGEGEDSRRPALDLLEGQALRLVHVGAFDADEPRGAFAAR